MSEETVTRETVVFYDTDCGGVVSNIAYLRFVERARCELFEKLGFALGEMESTGLFPTVVRSEVDYRAPARLGDSLEVVATLAEVGKLRMECRFEIRRVAPAQGEAPDLIAEAKQVVVLLQLPAGRPRPTPKEWRTASE